MKQSEFQAVIMKLEAKMQFTVPNSEISNASKFEKTWQKKNEAETAREEMLNFVLNSTAPFFFCYNVFSFVKSSIAFGKDNHTKN